MHPEPGPDTVHSAGTALGLPVTTLPGVGEKRAALLATLGIGTIEDLLWHFPRRYEDRAHLTPIAEAVNGAEVTVEAEIVAARNIRLRGRQSMALITLRDATGEMNATFFGRGFLANSALKPGGRGFFSGTVENYKGPALKNPEYEIMGADDDTCLNTGCIVPVYPLTDGLGQRQIRRLIADAMDAAGAAVAAESLPETIRNTHGLLPRGEAFRQRHYPDSLADAERARHRLAFEELLQLQLGILHARQQRMDSERGCCHTINGPVLAQYRAALPYRLTGAQQRVIDEILADMARDRPMLRLLQGDVGCGKTAVALHAIAAACDSGHQTAFMAPTEILAEQHLQQLRVQLEPLGVRVALLTGALRGASAVRAAIADGSVQVAVGTHALFQEKTQFNDLGLIVVDEQHRFGVLQRQRLMEKGTRPDILHMTATPIPRTLTLTVYGGMDLSLIDELPPGRQPVQTRRIPAGKVADLYDYIRTQAQAGFQSYIICPTIEASETRDELKSVIEHFEELTEGPFAGLRTELIHGRLDAGEKDEIMWRFKQGRIDVLFSTTVIEVGIDVPNATVMVIENAAQFGLTQLHQLRGRVGRGAAASWCFLLGEPTTAAGEARLTSFCQHASGFDIAEADWAQRGPGEMLGRRQAGLTDLRAADLLQDVRLLDLARREAAALLAADPGLTRPEHQALRRQALRYATMET